MKILIIENDAILAESLKTLLTSKGFQVELAEDGESGRDYAELGIYDFLIMDITVPGLDGNELASHIRSKRLGTAILMFSENFSVEDRITGLNAGADYYLPKPLDTRELLACINALLRRQGGLIDVLRYGNTALDLASSMLICGDQRIRLSAREFEVMCCLLQAGERNLPKETILSRVWGYDSNAVENHVEVYVGFLRKKLSSIGSNIKIVALRRMGYHLEVENYA